MLNIIETLMQAGINLTISEKLNKLLLVLMDINQDVDESPLILNTSLSYFTIYKGEKADNTKKILAIGSVSISLPVPNINSGSIYSISACYYSKHEYQNFSSIFNKSLIILINSENEINSLSEPLVFTFNFEISDIKNIIAFKHTLNIFPRCVYYDFDKSEWSDKGCQLINSFENIDLNPFESSTKPLFVTCSCTHLSIFSLSFESQPTSYPSFSNMQIPGTPSFDFFNLEQSFALYLLIIFIILFIFLMTFAIITDHKKNLSEVALFIFQEEGIYSISQKVEIFLTSLDNHHKEIPEKSLIAIELERLSNCKALEYSKISENIEENNSKGYERNRDKISSRQRRFIYQCDRVKDLIKNKEFNLLTVKQDLEDFQAGFKKETQVDKFIKRFGPETKMKKSGIKLKAKGLKQRHLNQLKIEKKEFFSMVVNKSDDLVPLPSSSTGLDYCNQ